MLMYTRKETTIVTQQEKVTNETRQQMNNLFIYHIYSALFDPSVVEKASFSYLRRAVFILSRANFY